jgi:hypothetical protein
MDYDITSFNQLIVIAEREKLFLNNFFQRADGAWQASWREGPLDAAAYPFVVSGFAFDALLGSFKLALGSRKPVELEPELPLYSAASLFD